MQVRTFYRIVKIEGQKVNQEPLITKGYYFRFTTKELADAFLARTLEDEPEEDEKNWLVEEVTISEAAFEKVKETTFVDQDYDG